MPAHHGDPPPEVSGQAVIIADFAYPLEVLRRLARSARSLVVLDHHKTVEADVVGQPEFEARFDLNKSGAVLAWEYAFPDRPVPALLQHIQDGDLWRWELPRSREVSVALSSYPFDFRVWQGLDVEQLRQDGEAILRYQTQQIQRLIERASTVELAGHRVPILNAPVWQSELGNQLAQGQPFAVLWYQLGDERVYSLRSTDEGVDVGALAKSLGGGGHRNAAGFRLSKPADHPFPASAPQPDAPAE
ncbi:MAG TPA: DHHA1 domain-containing protein [Dehalococcoidia bacterium]|nr:DHHA1 domain-containing protein [Dehalococcoidia bacterium]